MKFSENWLREFVNPAVGSAELYQRLTMAGLEVESAEPLGAGLDGVVVAEIVGCQPHPNADKLRVCSASIGQAQTLQIVCGAPNARVGLKAPLATIGARLPNGIEIKKAVLRGVESSGMLCSAKELGVDADASGLMELPVDAPVGTPLAKYLGLPDATIELKLTPNRPDCLGLRGLAYDVSALFGASVHEPKTDPVAVEIATQREVRLQAGADCPRFCGRVIEGIDAHAPTPFWMAERLRRSGLRPISLLVDVTNYAMLELGQPMHAFDASKLTGTGVISVRHARAGEKLTLLDEREVELNPDFLVVTDADRPVSLGGVMGGYDTRITTDTRDVFLEAAHWRPAAIMGRSRKLGLHTDAAHRFERGVDPELPRIAIERATRLILDAAGGKAGPLTETVRTADLPQNKPVHLRRDRLARVLGMRVEDTEVERILRALGMHVESNAEGWQVLAPSRRFDIEIEEDLIEEIVRVHGYERVPTRAPSGELRLGLRPEAEVAPARLGGQLAARGYREAICYSFVARDLLQRWALADAGVALANPLSADLAIMRTALLPGLVEALKHNLNRQQERVRLFETGLIFAQTDGELRQVPHLAAAACGRAVPESWATDKRELDFFDIKADVESVLALAGHRADVSFRQLAVSHLHPGRSAEVLLDGASVGIVGGLHPRLLKALDLDRDVYVFEVDLNAVSAGRVPRAHALSRFPSLRRDIAIVVPAKVAYATIEACARCALGTQLAEVVVFDQYLGGNLGDDVKSLAMGLILQDDSRTLTDEDADKCVARVLAALERECQARLRG
jgi:phenylalanyl-tRNA synthetase beta chain